MGKKTIIALIGVDKSQVPLDLSDEQWVDLDGDPDARARLREGLKRAGLDPSSFRLEPGRRPYPGFACLEEDDAAIFFGRDAQIVRGLDKMRGLVRTGVERMLVILGASGSGKSSFLRAGLWPRLKRDGREWLPLPIIRPERAVLSGQFGLAQALQRVMNDSAFADGIRKHDLPRSRAGIQEFLETAEDGLAKIFAALASIARVPNLSGEMAPPPTIVLAVDQGEELFNEEGRSEATRFIAMLTRTLKGSPGVLALVAMRSDAFPQLQNEPNLAQVPKETFTLDMMLEGSYSDVIERPARLVQPNPLKIDPQLTEALLADLTGQDALPLLAFTLAYLYERYAVDNELTLAGYEKLGRLKGVIDSTVTEAFADGVARGELPKDAKAQLALVRTAFIPHLARVNAAGQFVRRVAVRTEIPAAAWPLIDRFAERRLLIKDRRKVGGEDVDVVEVAHEALLREWRELNEALLAEREFLVAKGQLEQDVAEWRAAAESRKSGALLAGNKLFRARDWLVARPQDLSAEERQFIKASSDHELKQRRLRRMAAVAAFLAITAFAGYALLESWKAEAEKIRAEENTRIAQAEKQRADGELKKAQRTQSLFLADLARQKRSEGDATTAGLLALEALPDSQGEVARPYVPEAELQLDGAVRGLLERLVFKGHNDTVNTAAFSPDGKRIITASRDTARLWDAETGKQVGELKGDGPLDNAAFSPDGKRIITRDSGAARLWDAETSDPISEPFGDAINAAVFSPDGKRIVTASSDKTARLWDAQTGEPIGAPLSHEQRVNSAAFSADGKLIATASWELELDSEGRRIRQPGKVQIWDAESGKPIGEPLQGHEDEVRSVSFSPDGTRIITASADTTARLWDVETRSQLGDPLKGHKSSVETAQFSPDGKRIVTASSDKTARLWDAQTGEPIGAPLSHEQVVNSAAFSADGKLIATASGELEYSRGRRAQPRGKVQLWDAASGKPIGEPLQGHEGSVRSVSFSLDGKRIVTASDDKTARLWDVETRSQLGDPLNGHKSRVETAQFSPDGKRIVTASWDTTARLWDAETGEPIGEPLSHGSFGINSAVFSPDGKRIVTASTDRTARVWDAETGKPIGEPLKGHLDSVRSALFSLDGKRILTASRDPTVKLWDIETGKPILELKGHEGPVWTAKFSPNGKRIVTVSKNTARLWELFADTNESTSNAKKVIPRCLTVAQRTAFFLPPEPPLWCIELEKWPYDSPAWKQWLVNHRAGKNPPLPTKP